MLALSEELLAAIHAHGEEAFPHECCGLLIGRRDGDVRRVERVVRARNLNVERAADRYELDPADRLRAEREADEAGLELVGFYHSHPDHDAYFSATDLARSEEVQWGEPWLPPTYAYLVLSVRGGAAGLHRAFEVHEGRAREIQVSR